MKKLTLSTLLIASMLVSSVSVIAQSEAELKQKIEKMNDDMAQAMMAGNHEKNLQYYTDDVVSMPSYEKMLTGKDALKKSMDEMAKSGWKISDFNFETVSVESNGNVISEIGKYRMEMKKQGMDQTMKDEGKYLTLWEKQPDGSLKIKTEIWNTDKNPWEEMSAAMPKEDKNMMGEKQDEDMGKEHKDKRAHDELRPENEKK